eukprot:TRINITY_DN6327_c0_g1_i1.p1 TRINITY_DN6327_c0_g1~~TRINITY_DN6327_c0_g1_i1.p1  ORF type:complete len:576 (+),score=82.30 TRINITY_DN6327_c0_g1_i1:67-1728(+)
MAAIPPGRAQPRPPDAARTKFVPHSIEDQVRLAYHTPTPHEYHPYNPKKPDITEPKQLGRISDYNPPSALDYEAKHKGYVPGPGSYETPDLREFPLPEGGRVNRVAPVQRLKVEECPIPAPGQYGVPSDPARPSLVSGRFSRDPRVTAFIKEQEMLSRGIPAPGAHEVLESMEMTKPFCPEGGRFSDSNKPPSYFDVAPKLSAANPPPGSYETKGSIESKAVGRTVFRYESATIGETKELITKVVGDANDAPGPGHYKMHDPGPLGGVPAQKGRMLPYSMPHPFAYNCAPDATRTFVEPVRSRNNADQIFGTGVRQGGSRRNRKGNRTQSEGRLEAVDHLAELPMGVGAEEKPEEEGVVQWRSGGFSNLKKSRSTGAVRNLPEIDETVAQGVGKSYPPLAQKKRGNSTFLPMSSRRTEKVKTYDASQENQRLGNCKWKLSKVCEGISTAANAVLEPLDVDKLKRNAIVGLRDKALNRMKLQGVCKDQQQVILEEMDSLLQESTGRARIDEWSQAGEDFEQDPNLQPEAQDIQDDLEGDDAAVDAGVDAGMVAT